MSISINMQSELRGTALLPASKSISARALILAALTDAGSHVGSLEECLPGLSDADDTKALLRGLYSSSETIDVGAAGTAMRFLTAYLAQKDGTHLLTGSERMKQRPIGILVSALRALGADISYACAEGYPPLKIRGARLRSGTVRLSASVSSQYVSAMLMIAPTLPQGLTLRLDGNVASRPYIDMTLELMKMFGASYEWLSDSIVHVPHARYNMPEGFSVEADWSAASYWYEMVALSDDPEARIFLPHLHKESLQGDSRVAELFLSLGVKTEFTNGGALLTKAPQPGTPLAIDLSNQPDLAQTLVVTCAILQRPFTFSGLRSLRIKETDRTAALQAELLKLGCQLEAIGDDVVRLLPAETQCAENPCISTYDDHRMAMAFAPCAYKFPSLCIDEPQVVSKSYPTFWQELAKFAQIR